MTATSARRLVRRARRRTARIGRRLSSPWRALPDFVVIGAMKCGTSSLHAAICEHPQVAAAQGKELRFFTRHAGRGVGAYRASFPMRRHLARAHAITGEATPAYLASAEAARRAAAVVPDARLLVVLRDPVDRSLSHYFHERARGERRPIEDALDPEASLDPASVDAARTGRYLGFSRYAEGLGRWLEVYPAEQVLVLVFEDLLRDPDPQLAALWRFLGLPGHTVRFPHRNASPRDEVPAAVIRRLEAELAQPNRDLAALLAEHPEMRPPGAALPEWLAAAGTTS